MKENKYITSLIAVIVFILLLKGCTSLLYIKSEFTCGKFTSEFSVHGSSYYEYTYKVGKTKYEDKIAITELRGSLEELKKDSCVMIEYSVYAPSLASRVVDKRILKK